MADNFEFLKNLGVSKADLSKPANAYEEMLMDMAKELMLRIRDTTLRKAQNTGGLAASIGVMPKGQLTVAIDADYYFKFMDEGVNPVGGKIFPESDYSFKKPFVSKNHAAALQSWKGYTPQRAYASAYVTKNRYGLKPRDILKDTINEDLLKKMSNDLSTLMGMTLEVQFTNNTKTWR